MKRLRVDEVKDLLLIGISAAYGIVGFLRHSTFDLAAAILFLLLVREP